MHCLEVIRSINNRASVPNAVQSRDCSFCQSRTGVVLHSAKLRSTAFLAGPHAVRFLRSASRASRAKLNRLIESQF